MRFFTPLSHTKQWWLFIFFKEIGRPQIVRVGGKDIQFGKGREAAGRYAMVRIEINDSQGSIELFPGTRILSLVCSPTAELDQQHMNSLVPERDEVELVNPRAIVDIKDLSLAREVAGDNDAMVRQIEVLQGKRKTFYGAQNN